MPRADLDERAGETAEIGRIKYKAACEFDWRRVGDVELNALVAAGAVLVVFPARHNAKLIEFEELAHDTEIDVAQAPISLACDYEFLNPCPNLCSGLSCTMRSPSSRARSGRSR